MVGYNMLFTINNTAGDLYMNMRQINVALIDSMVKKIAFPNYKIHTFTITSDCQVSEYDCVIENNSWLHGTVCARIILELTPDVNLFCINVFDEKNQISFERLDKAIEFAYDQGCEIVNLSLASTYFKDKYKFQEILSKYWDKMIFVTSCSNKGILSFPAAFSQTISLVGANDLSLMPNEFISNENPLLFADFIARTPQNINIANHVYEIEIPNPNSYATPVVTSHIVDILKENNAYMDINNVKNALSRRSKNKSFISIKDNLLLRYSRFQWSKIDDLSVPVISVDFTSCEMDSTRKIISNIFEIIDNIGYNPLKISTFYNSKDVYFLDNKCFYNNTEKLKSFLESEIMLTETDFIIIIYSSSHRNILISDLDIKIINFLFEDDIGKKVWECISQTFLENKN